MLLLIIFASSSLISCSQSTTPTTTTTIPGAAEYIKEPYLLYTNDSGKMTVQWQADKTPASAKIEWGPTSSYGNQAAVTETNSGDWGHQFAYTFTGLTPKARTYYRVTIDGTAVSGSFRAASPATDTSLTFYAYGDNRDGAYVHNQVLQQLMSDMAADPDHRQTFCLHAGDLTMDGEDEDNWVCYFTGFNESGELDYPYVLQFLQSLPVLMTLGNHEIYHADYSTPAHPGDLVRKYWPFSFYAQTDRSYYSFDYGPVHVTVLDQYNDTGAYTVEGSAQYNWMVNDLNSTKPWKIVMFHEPAWTDSTATGYNGNNLDIQKHLCPVFKAKGVKLVIQGHIHNYARVNPPDGITYLTLGGGGATLSTPDTAAANLIAYAKAYHFARFDIVGNTMNVTVIDSSGATLDTFSLSL